MRTICPSCQSKTTVRNGRIHTGKQNRKCKDCGRQFVEEPEKVFISQEKWAIVDRLLLEKLPISGIARALQISESWLQEYVKRKYAQVSQKVEVTIKKKES
jgi:transposase-like protein